MALALYDRVQQTGTANTTVSFTLSGTVTGFQSFTAIGNGNTTYYAATDSSGNWEVGLGTYSTTGPTLTRTTIYSSSNSGSAVTFSGAVNVFVTYPAGYSVVSSNNAGTSGQVLTSAGAGVAPSWGAAPAGSAATPTALGTVYGSTLSTGVFSTFVGYQAGNTTATSYGNNTYVGYQVGVSTTTGYYNTGIGLQSLSSLTSGFQNSALGMYALQSVSSGTNNVAIGYQSLINLGTASNNTALGAYSLRQNTATGNTAVGYFAAYTNSSGTNNTAIGYQSLYSNSTGTDSTAIGNLALNAATGGTCTALGSSAGSSLTTGTNNIVIGYNAQASSATVSNENTFGNSSTTNNRIWGALSMNSGVNINSSMSTAYNNNIAIGGSAGRYLGNNLYNIAIGIGALYSGGSNGGYNIAMGWNAMNQAGPDTTAGAGYNIHIGYQAGYANSTGQYNVGIGANTLTAVTSGSFNCAYGPNAGSTLTTGSNNILIGYGAAPTSITVSNEFTHGNSSITSNRFWGDFKMGGSAAGTSGQVLTSAGAGVAPTWATPSSGGGISWQSVQTASFTAVAGNAYPVNTTSAQITVTLPASPTAGQMIIITDYAGTSATNNIIIDPNTNKLQGNTGVVVINVNRQAFNLVYADATQGWISYAQNYAALSFPLSSYLVVAGGGGASQGAGGAGGMLSGNVTLTSGQVYTVTVGAGGAGGGGGAVGSNSSISGTGITTVIALGGGNGGNAGAGGAGGSGGGGGSQSGGGAVGGAGTSGQGYSGGAGNSSAPYSTGGGGGAGGVGSPSTTAAAGVGGNGAVSTITGSSVTYAGGGGGGVYQSPGTAAAGGSGGGGAGGGVSSNGVAGTANTGGGGGGAYGGGTYSGGSGGKGIVILSIPTASYTGTTTGSPTVTTNGIYKVLSFTSSGSYTA